MNFREATEAILKGHILSYKGQAVTSLAAHPNMYYKTNGYIWIRLENDEEVGLSYRANSETDIPELKIDEDRVERVEHPVEEMRITLND